jgi:hypothetical protein
LILQEPRGAIAARTVANWLVELVRAVRGLRSALRQNERFVRSLPTAERLPDAVGRALLDDKRPVAVRIDAGGLHALKRAALASGSPAKVALEVQVPAHDRGVTPEARVTLDGTLVGRIDGANEVERWALRTDLTLDGGTVRACGTLRPRGADAPSPYTLEISLPPRKP